MAGSNKVVFIGIISIIVVIGVNIAMNENVKTEVSIHKKCEPDKNTVCLGFIFPRTGDLSSHGNENLKSAELAVVEFNKKLPEDIEWILDYQVEDSATNSVVAFEQMEKLHAKNINIILGLEASENISEILGYAERRNMLLVSCCSSAPVLAIPNDNLFRFVPDDSNQGEVLAKLMLKDGIKTAIPIWRDDVWGNGLYNETKKYFEKYGGNFTGGITYNPNSPESVSMSELNKMVINYTKNDTKEVGVLFLSFKEIARFMELAEKSKTRELEGAKWYGPGAITKEKELTMHPSNLFTHKINLTTVQVAASGTSYDMIQKNLTTSFNAEPNSFVYPSYDTVGIVGKAILETHHNDVEFIKTNIIREIIPEIAAKHTDSAIGTTELNDAGDLAKASYDVLKLQNGKWIKVGYYYTDEKEWKFEPLDKT